MSRPVAGGSAAEPVNPFDGITDVAGLRTTLHALSALLSEIVAEIETVAAQVRTGRDRAELRGLRTAKVTTLRRIGWAVAQLDRLVPRPVSAPDPARPALFTPTAGTGQPATRPVMPVVTGISAAGSDLCTLHLWLPPHGESRPQVHHYTHTVVIVLQGTARTVWWDANGNAHELDQGMGQHLYVPPGVPYRLTNPHGVPVIAVMIRTHPDPDGDTDTDPPIDLGPNGTGLEERP